MGHQVGKESPLPSISFTSVLNASWPHACDATSGNSFSRWYKSSIVSAAGVCTTCWQCSCSGCQNLAWRCVRQDKDLKKENEEALLLCGYQGQLAKENWSQTAADLLKSFASKKKEVETLKQELERQECHITKYKEDIEVLKNYKKH